MQKHTVQRKFIVYVVHTNGRLSQFSLVLSIVQLMSLQQSAMLFRKR